MSNTKQYSKELDKENNTLAIVIAFNYLMSTGHYTYDSNPLDQIQAFKDHDFILLRKKDSKPISIEVERKKSWKKSGQWEGFKTLDVPARKRESKSDIFIMVNYNSDTIAVMKTKDVIESPTYTKDTIYTESEEFFAVDLSLVKFVTMNWQTV